MLTILISGATGFISRSFQKLFSNKYNFILLSHTSQSGNMTIAKLYENSDIIKQVDVVLNLAGANIGEKKWSIKRKQELLNSRVETTRQLVELFNKHNPHAHFISASAIGIYDPDTLSDETTPVDYAKYNNFSQEITRKWEKCALGYAGSITVTRFGVVLADSGGAFPKMLQPFLLFSGGRLGSGQQYFPWIALPDLLNALELIIDNQLSGTYNMVAPEMVDNSELSRQIARIWHRPNWLHLPTFLIKLIFGQMGQELFLNSILVKPKQLMELKFNYRYPLLEDCLSGIKAGKF